MTILHASFWSHKGKYLILLEDDLKDTECEGQFDVQQNRFDQWLEKKVKFKVLLSQKVAATAGAKNSMMSTKCTTWLQERKVEWTAFEACPPIAAAIASNLRLILVELDPESRQNFLQGKTNLKSLSTKTWADLHDEVTQFIEKHSKDKKNPVAMESLRDLEKELKESVDMFPFLSGQLKKDKSDRVLSLFKKCKEPDRESFASFVMNLCTNMTAVCVTDALMQALKTDDRVYFMTSSHENSLPKVHALLTSVFGMELNIMFPSPEDGPSTDPVADKEFGQVVDSFLPKANKAKDKKKKAAQKKKKKDAAGGAPAGAGENKDKPAADKGKAAPKAEQKTTASGGEKPKAETKAPDAGKAEPAAAGSADKPAAEDGTAKPKAEAGKSASKGSKKAKGPQPQAAADLD